MAGVRAGVGRHGRGLRRTLDERNRTNAKT
jgi:hypothetical protein